MLAKAWEGGKVVGKWLQVGTILFKMMEMF